MVLWSYHTITQTTIRETHFRLTYGSEAMISVEIEEPSPRRQNPAPGDNFFGKTQIIKNIESTLSRKSETRPKFMNRPLSKRQIGNTTKGFIPDDFKKETL